jgi:hypothetical protein
MKSARSTSANDSGLGLSRTSPGFAADTVFEASALWGGDGGDEPAC